MPSLSLSIQYQVNTGSVFTPTELSNLFFFGIPLLDSMGAPMSDEDLSFYLDSAQTQVEHELNIKLTRKSLEENLNYYYDDWKQWGYIPVNYPAEKALSLKGYVQSSLQVDYPIQWLSTKGGSEKYLYHRNVSLVPVSGSTSGITNSTIFFGITPYVGYFGSKIVPNYWSLIYITGWDRIPADVLELIGKLTAVSIYTQLGDLIFGAGIQSKSQSIDGLSQSISSKAFLARIQQYEKDIDRLLTSAKNSYRGILFGVL